MASLIVVNGPPAIGKSTIARMYVEAHPMSLLLDLDDLRSTIGGWRENPTRAGLLTRQLAVEMAPAHLLTGCDVVVPQYLARLEFLDELRESARFLGARSIEVVLMADRAEAIARFHARTGSGAATPHDRDAARMVDHFGGLDGMFDRLAAFVEQRPDAVIVESVRDDPALTYQRFLAALDEVG